MGFTPRQIDQVTLWELAVMSDAVAKANGAEDKPAPMTDDEYDAALAQLGYL